MTFGKEKRTLLGWMALAAPIPLPLNDVLEWPVLFVYSFLVIYFLQRVDKGAQTWLPNWALNLLGTLYLPVLYVDLQMSLAKDQAVKALMHLILFLVVVKLFSMRKEREKWHVFVAIFFIFVAAMGTSSHLTIFIYLVAALAVGFAVMSRFTQLHMSAQLGTEPAEQRLMPSFSWPMLTVAMGVLALSIPIFAMMPRLNQPLLMGQGGNNLSLARTTGFSDRMNLNLTSEIRGNRKVAMRIQALEGGLSEDMRFKGTSYTFYRRNNWYRDPDRVRSLFPRPEQTFVMPGADLDNVKRATVFLEPLRSASVILPTRTHAVVPAVPLGNLTMDTGGAILFPGAQAPRQAVQYDVLLGPDDHVAAPDPESTMRPDWNRPNSLDTRGVSDRMAQLAADVMGEGGDRERSDRLLRHLIEEYTYTTDFVGRDGENPLEDFLFEYKSGHCEYFASAMVLMLRTQGVPARLVTGFLGAELNPIEGYYVVRQQNAHAWVEAWVDGKWRIYDPTPPDGRPAASERSLRLLLQQIYDYVAFRWDRYVLTYSSQDQQSFWQTMKQKIADTWDRIRRWRGQEDPTTAKRRLDAEDPSTVPNAGVEQGEEIQALWQDPKVRYGGLSIFLVTMLGAAIYFKRRPLPPMDVYERLRKGLEIRGLPVDSTTAPLELRRLLEDEHPRSRDDVALLIGAYVRNSFAGQDPDPAQRALLRPALVRVLRVVSEDLKEREKAEPHEPPSTRAA